jgi:hypothetical protein
VVFGFVIIVYLFQLLDAAGGNKQSATVNQKRLDDEDDIVQCARDLPLLLRFVVVVAHCLFLTVPTLRPEIRKRIVQARQAKGAKNQKKKRKSEKIGNFAISLKFCALMFCVGWTQKDLAQAINEKPQVVAAYESPTAKTITNHTILTKMERALGTKLRGD